MTIIKNYFSSLTLRLIGGVIGMLLVYNLIIQSIGYLNFKV